MQMLVCTNATFYIAFLEICADPRSSVAGTQHPGCKVLENPTRFFAKSAAATEPFQRKPMNIVKPLSFFASLILTFTPLAFASVIVTSPANSAQVASPFRLSATASSCSSQPVNTMGFSFDNSSDTTVVDAASISEEIVAGTGAHTLHVKAWGDEGASCVTDIAITVTTAATSKAQVPSDATSISNVQVSGDWKANHDTAAGSSSGTMSIVSSPAHSGSSRKFVTKYSANGDERYQVSFGDDESATNFLYDGWIYLTISSSAIGNLEMDLNQVMSNGQTVIYGVQCDGWSGTWDYTANAGTAAHPKDVWIHSKSPCNPRKWSINTWHHIQLSYSRNDSGVVTYHSVWLDDTEQELNATVLSAFSLGWGPTLLTNFQIDGLGASGSNTVYLDDLVIYRW
jgi:hypothetical protein